MENFGNNKCQHGGNSQGQQLADKEAVISIINTVPVMGARTEDANKQ